MKTVIEMAMEAGVAFDSEEYPEIWMTYMNVGREEIERLVEIVRADEREKQAEAFQQILTAIQNQTRTDEREACAKVCESFQQDPYEELLYKSDFAAAIRARSST